MRSQPLLALLLLVAAPAEADGQATLRPFESDAELLSYFRAVHDSQERARQEAEAAWRRRAEAMRQCQENRPQSMITKLLPPASPTAVIHGRVLDEQDKPVGGTRVVLSPLGLTAVSAPSGEYRIVVPAESLASPQKVLLTPQSIGYVAARHDLTVRQRDSVHLDLRLCTAPVSLSAIMVTGFQGNMMAERARSITNTQHAGVDEGGIVKLHEGHLVILRRGRLFTVAVGDADLRPVSAIDAFGPDVNPRRTWYDELLVAAGKVVVIGYSYDRGGTEVGVFDIDRAGKLRYRATYQLRSNDYYSSRNYASRLIGHKLIFYAPLYLWHNLRDPFAALPAIRRWRRGAGDRGFERIVPAHRVYRAPLPVSAQGIALHTVTTCDLAPAGMACEASVIVGPSGRVFYVSDHAVYIWTTAGAFANVASGDASLLYRMPLDGSAPTALQVAGSPVDQFSFLESDDRYLTVLVRTGAQGDAMWLPEASAGDAALLRIPLATFGDGSRHVPWWRYRRLPAPSGYTFHNRFVGDHLLYGVGSGWGRARHDSATLYAVPWREDRNRREEAAVTQLLLPHGIDRIEVMGDRAVVIGTDSANLHFSAIRLDGMPAVAQRFVLEQAAQGELRSHGFFYRHDGPDSGVLGLPVREPGRPGYRHLFEASAGVVFLRNHAGVFRSLGALKADQRRARDDRCRASCVDWYGNARPLFLGGRVLALLGYELVEGAIAGDEIREVRRVGFGPRDFVTSN